MGTASNNKQDDLKDLINSFASFFTKEFSDKEGSAKAETNEIVMRTLLNIIAGKNDKIRTEDKIKAISLYKEFVQLFFDDKKDSDKI